MKTDQELMEMTVEELRDEFDRVATIIEEWQDEFEGLRWWQLKKQQRNLEKRAPVFEYAKRVCLAHGVAANNLMRGRFQMLAWIKEDHDSMA